MSENNTNTGKFLGCGCFGWAFALVIFLILFGIGLGPVGSQKRAPENSALQQSRQIGLMLFSFSNDNNGRYPDGNSSTEVFQKLIDGNYCSDPSVFYIPRAGKSKALPGQKLKPENVCFDVTGGLEADSRDDIPLVFTTGYKIDYLAGGAATPIKDSPQFSDARTFLQWWHGDTAPWGDPGIALCCASKKGIHALFLHAGNFVASKSNEAIVMGLDAMAASEGIIPDFIPPDFKPDGKTYRQLTPDGPLPPQR